MKGYMENQELILRLLQQLDALLVEAVKLQKFIAGELIKRSKDIEHH